MATPFCPGYAQEPYASLVTGYPADPTYPTKDFRTEWGPIFHRGRLDGSARLFAIGQDPAQHEAVARRILVGTAGKRAQGFMAKLGITRSYALINTFLYSVYGQAGGTAHIGDAAIAAYRNRWIQAVLDHNSIEAVVAFGSLADQAWQAWLHSPAASGRPVLPYQHVQHPTYPISAGQGQAGQVAQLTKAMLAGWNAAIAALKTSIKHADGAFGTPYGDDFKPAETPDIPLADLPAGTPPWMATDDGWANRAGATAAIKRRTIEIVVPSSVVL